MKVSDIRRGKLPDQVQLTSVEDFFKKRATNSVRKTTAGNWDILYEDDKFIYFGYPCLKLFSDDLKMDTLYKVDKMSMLSLFPKYQTVDGVILKRAIAALVNQHTAERDGEHDLYTQSISVWLHRDYLDAFVKRTKADGAITSYSLMLDKDTLELIRFL